jgi:hypothetical protein
MNIFISWSGERSNKISGILKRWMKKVIPSAELFFSKDIPGGDRWSASIAKQLENTNFGILCVTKDNFEKPWLLFEAGALSKVVDEARVVPLLFDVEPSDLAGSPLSQFQAVSFAKADLKKLLCTINNASEKKLDSDYFEALFEGNYSKLKTSLNAVKPLADDEPSDTERMLSEILAGVKSNAGRLSEIHTGVESNKWKLENIDNKVWEYDFSIRAKIDAIRMDVGSIKYKL